MHRMRLEMIDCWHEWGATHRLYPHVKVETNNNGEKFLAWCSKAKMKIVNSMFRTKRIHRGTWLNPATGKWKRLDYICTSGWVLKFVQSCRAYIGPSKLFDTDHRLVVMNIAFPVSKRYVKLFLLKGATNEPKLRRNFNVLRDGPEKRRLLAEKTEEQFELINIEETMLTYWTKALWKL